MKHTYTKVLFGALLIGAFLMPEVVEGKSVSWSKNEASSLVYFWNCSSGGCSGGATGWELGLSAPQITVRYNANVYNADTGALIIDGSSLTVGTRLRFAAAPYSDSDIDWAATGYTNDSPNGHWINGAAAPAFACEAGDISAINANDGLNNRYTIYTPLSINPPNSSLDFTGTTTALTNQGGGVYRVDSSGAIQAQFVFAPTYGEFYYRYKMTFKNFAPMLLNVNQCYGNQTPMEVSTGFSFPSCFVGFCPPTYGHTDYRLDVPQMSVPFSFTVPSTNNNPNPPSLTGPTTGSTNINYPFTTQASDPDGDTVRYGIDWDNNNVVDEWTTSVTSNTAVNTNHQWATPGTYTLKALTQDSKNAVSGWSTPLTITIQTIVNGTCGAANSFPTTNPPTVGLCFSGTNTPVTPGVAPGPYSWTCLGSGGGPKSPVCTAPYLEPAPVVDLKINGSDTPITIARNGNLNITWGNIPYAVSCTGTGNNWTGGKFTTGGNDNIQATAASLYTLTCTNSQGISASDSISVTLAPTLKICQNSCSGSIEPPASFSMDRYDTKDLVACHNDAVSCTDATGDVTTSATWTEGGGNPVSLGGSSPKTLTADNVGTESIQATYSGNTVIRSVTVTCTDSGACQRDSRSQSLCQKDNFTVTDNCGQIQNCTGEKTCDYNWKEVAP